MGPALDVAIGIIFLYFVLALVTSTSNAAISTVVGLRARSTQVGLINLLSGKNADGVETLKERLNRTLLKALTRPGQGGDDLPETANQVDPPKFRQRFKTQPSS